MPSPTTHSTRASEDSRVVGDILLPLAQVVGGQILALGDAVGAGGADGIDLIVPGGRETVRAEVRHRAPISQCRLVAGLCPLPSTGGHTPGIQPSPGATVLTGPAGHWGYLSSHW